MQDEVNEQVNQMRNLAFSRTQNFHRKIFAAAIESHLNKLPKSQGLVELQLANRCI